VSDEPLFTEDSDYGDEVEGEPPVSAGPKVVTNEQIATQLSSVATLVESLSARIGVLEQRDEDGSDISGMVPMVPTGRAGGVDDIRADTRNRSRAAHYLQREGLFTTDDLDVAALIKQKSKRSGYLKTAADFVLHDEEWPQFHVTRIGQPPVTYDSLTVAEFGSGFLERVLGQYVVPRELRAALGYLRDTFTEVHYSDWKTVRGANRVAFQAVEQGRVVKGDYVGMGEVRDQAIRQATRARLSAAPVAAAATAAVSQDTIQPGMVPCANFQLGACDMPGDHYGPDGNQACHDCAYCWRVAAKRCSHPEVECRRKISHQQNQQSKNSSGGSRRASDAGLNQA